MREEEIRTNRERVSVCEKEERVRDKNKWN